NADRGVDGLDVVVRSHVADGVRWPAVAPGVVVETLETDARAGDCDRRGFHRSWQPTRRRLVEAAFRLLGTLAGLLLAFARFVQTADVTLEHLRRNRPAMCDLEFRRLRNPGSEAGRREDDENECDDQERRPRGVGPLQLSALDHDTSPPPKS